MNRNQSPTTNRGIDARVLTVAVALIAGVIGSFVMPLWSVALMLLATLLVMHRIAAVQPAPAPVVIRRDSRR